MTQTAATVPTMGDLFKIGPYDLTYKPECTPALAWSLLSGGDRYELARRHSPAWRAAWQRWAAEYDRRRAEERAEFRAMFPLVDLDGIPKRAWATVGRKCDQCRLDGDWPARLHGSGGSCWIWQAAYFYTDQAGTCGWCGEVMAANLVKTAIDHIIPVSRSGPDDRWNRQLLHTGCNSSKGARLTDRAYALAAAHGFVIPDL